MKRPSRTILLATATTLLAVPATAQLAVYDAGTAGDPPVAVDPLAQGWSRRDGPGAVAFTPISPDGTSGLNAYEISDSDPSPVGYGYYHIFPGSTSAMRAFLYGTWELTATMRMTAGPSDSIVLEASSGFTIIDTQYRIYFRIVGGDVVVRNPTTGQTYVAGPADGNYHTYTIRKTQNGMYLPAEILRDGVVLGPLNETFPSFTNDYGVIFGASENNAQGRARFHRVELRALAAPGTGYCGPAVNNSTGAPATLEGYGSAYANENFFELRAAHLPPNQFGYFLASQATGFVQGPGGSQGNLCLSGSIARFVSQLQNSGASGTMSIPVDLTAIPLTPPQAVLAGDTWNFQCWYRDQNPVSTSNFSPGYAVEFR